MSDARMIVFKDKVVFQDRNGKQVYVLYLGILPFKASVSILGSREAVVIDVLDMTDCHTPPPPTVDGEKP